MKKKILLLIGCFSICLWAGAQSPDPSLLSVAGEESQGTTMSIQWTLGEAMVASYTTEKGMVTEGFIQPSLTVLELPSSLFHKNTDAAASSLQIDIWPTPVSDFLNIKVQGASEEGVSLTLYDLNGKPMLIQDLDSALEKNELDLQDINNGNYILQFRDADGSPIRSFIIVKIRQ